MMARAREQQALKIAKINRAAAIGRLMMGQLLSSGWPAFLRDTDPADLSARPRRQLRGAVLDVRERLAGDVDRFCRDNFLGMTVEKLALLHTAVKQRIPDGLRMSLTEFEKEFGKVRRVALRDVPPHSTVSISLWGLQFEYPEHHFMNDVEIALRAATAAHEIIKNIGSANQAIERRDELKDALQREKAYCRYGLLACFSLVEAYLNGLAWALVHNKPSQFAALSKTQKNLIEDTAGTTFRDKLIKYPELLTGMPLWNEQDSDVATFLSLLKPFRDSLCHPSPFETPAKFGGYNKLSKVYGLTLTVFTACVALTLTLIERLHRHVDGVKEAPHWMSLYVTFSETS